MKINWRREAGQLSSFSRAVVAKRTVIGSTVGVTVMLLTGNHLIPTDWAGSISHWVNVGLDGAGVVSILLGIFLAHQAATPADPQLLPKDKYGNPMFSANLTGPHGGRGNGDPDPATAALAAATAIFPMLGTPTAAPAVPPAPPHTPGTPEG